MRREYRQRFGVRSGFVAVATAVLTLALFATPLVAAQSDFGHEHPADECPHVHELDGVLTQASSATATVHAARLSLTLATGTQPTPAADSPVERANPIRGPPLAPVP